MKPPYNVSDLNQQAAIEAINRKGIYQKNKTQILKEKEKLYSRLSELEIVTKIYPSEANFFLVETKNANQVYKELVKQKIIVRNRNNVVRNCIRITVGTDDENQILIQALKSI